jgi:outer membrane murein-binding lipoprotein Lpp
MNAIVWGAGVLAVIFSSGCTGSDSRSREDRSAKQTEELRAKFEGTRVALDEMKAEVQLLMDAAADKSGPAMLSPTGAGYSNCVTSEGLLIPVSVDSVESIPGGVRYTIGITNIYSIGLNHATLTVTFSGNKKEVAIQGTINPGSEVVTHVGFSVDNGKYPKFLFVSVAVGGMQFRKQR